MIITDKFIWYHLPKTGGNQTEMAIEHLMREKVRYNSRYDKNIKEFVHSAKVPEMYKAEKLTSVIGIRKLPQWLISHANHHYNYSKVVQKMKREDLYELIKSGKTVSRNGKPMYADNNIAKFKHIFDAITPSNIIRQEHLREDIGNFISKEYCSVDLGLRFKNLLQFPAGNKQLLTLEITEDDIKRMYEKNPIWSEIEEKAYNRRG